ncbi:MAG: glycosyltransferase family 2 protein [Patescibacteria group bacterium]
MKFSFIILNYNTANLLRLCLKNLYSLNIPVDFEVMVVDNASNDKSINTVKEKFPQVKLITNKENTGHAQGNNSGIKVARGEYLIILNTDIIIPSFSTIERIVKFMESHPRAAIVGPKLLNGDGTIQNSCFRPYNTLTPIYRRTPIGNIKFAKADLNRHLMTDFNHNESKEVEWILGACMFIKKDALDKIGMFNEKFKLYFADFELCDRAKMNNYKVYYFADSDIIHYHRRESAEKSEWPGFPALLNKYTYIHIKDWIKYLKIKYAKKKN